MKLINVFRLKLALWLMPDFERFKYSEAMKIYSTLCLNFGGRAIRELRYLENIAEIRIIRESDQSLN